MGYCEICYAACEARYCAGCAPSAPPAPAQVVLKREARLDGHSDRVYDVAWGSDNRLASVGQVGGFVWSIPDQKQLAPLDGDELMRVCWHGDAVITGSSLGKMQVCSPSDGRPKATLDTDQEDEVYGLESLTSNLAVGAGDTLQLLSLIHI